MTWTLGYGLAKKTPLLVDKIVDFVAFFLNLVELGCKKCQGGRGSVS